MKKVLLVLAVELMASALFALAIGGGATINYDYFTALGLCNFIIGLLGCLGGAVALAVNKETAKAVLIGSGLLLLIGFLTCSIFPMRLNTH